MNSNSSSLSNALNYHLSQQNSRQRGPHHRNENTFQPAVLSPPTRFIPHRSQLQDAFSTPAIGGSSHIATAGQSADAGPSNTRRNLAVAQDILRVVRSAKSIQEAECARRSAWEKEQEARFAQRHADLQLQLDQLRQEMSAHNEAQQSAVLSTSTSGFLGDHSPPSPSWQSSPQYYEDDQSHSMTSTEPLLYTALHGPHSAPASSHISTASPSPAPLTPEVNLEPDDFDDATSDYGSPLAGPAPQTIKAVMKERLITLMDLENSRLLPESYTEGGPVSDEDPIRFVWEKTLRQSVHNQKMKARVIEDLRSNRHLYKIDKKELRPSRLSAVFDQLYSTFRQRYREQNSGEEGTHVRRRDNARSRARRLSRKKIKLSSRSEARLRIGKFEHSGFDSAFVLGCISSDESDYEVSSPELETAQQAGTLRKRVQAWRSQRLQHFYDTLDNEDDLHKALVLKRTSGRRERFLGPVQDGLHFPPEGVGSWMISKNWRRRNNSSSVDFATVLHKKIQDANGFDASHFPDLGDESDLEPGLEE